MIHEKKFIVSLNDLNSSQTFTIDNGLQQGTVNSSILFSFYINDILNTIENNLDNIKIIAFPDDLIIYKSSIKHSISQKPSNRLLKKYTHSVENGA